jgi:cytochrome c oxidase subunit 5a
LKASRMFSSFRYIYTPNPSVHKSDPWLESSQQRNLNNAFAYDLVPAPSVIVAALKAARRVNDYPTAVRVFEGGSSCSTITRRHTNTPFPLSGIKAKVENQGQYDEYLGELESIRKELGIELRETMYPESSWFLS